MKTRSRKTRLRRYQPVQTLFAVVVCCALPWTDSHAEQSEAAALEEIIVTAQRREQSLQSTPISMEAFTTEQLRARDVTNVADLARAVTNFTMQPATAGGSSSGQFFIRGVGQFDFFNTADPGVALYLDGVIIPRAAGAAFDLPDIERIEVLRGPQGTLYGRNAIAGAVNLHTRRPVDDEPVGEASVTIGSRNRMDLRAFYMTPLVEDKVHAKLAATSTNQDGYITRVGSGEDMGDENTQSVSTTLYFNTSETVDVELKADYMHKRGNSGAEVMTALAPSPLRDLYNALYLAPRGLPLFDEDALGNENETHTGIRNRDDFDHWGLAVTVNWDLGFGQFKSISAYRDLETHFGLDFDGSPAPFSDQLVDDDGNFFSQEFQLSGTAWDGRLEWLVGAYYFTEETNSDVTLFFLDGAYVLDDDFTDFFTFFLTTADRSVIENNDVDTDSIAFFTQETFRLTDSFSITAGLRYTRDDKDLFANHFEYNTGNELINLTRGDSWDDFSPKLGFEYQPNEELLLYASAARGFRSGGFNGRAFSGNALGVTVYDPEYIWAYEAGIKSDWLDGRLRFNASYYFYDYEDFQFDTTEVIEGQTVFAKGNAAKAEIKGFEAELDALLADNIRLRLAAGHIDSEFTEVDERVLNLPLDTKFINSPEWTYSAGLISDFELDGGELTFRADYLSKSRVWFLFNNRPLDNEDDHRTLDASLTYRPGNGNWSLSVFGRNILDNTYKLHSITSSAFFGGATVVTYAPGAEWGANVTVGF